MNQKSVHKANNVVKGGFVNLPIAIAKYIESKGGKIITGSSVAKILIKNDKAKVSHLLMALRYWQSD
jgi:phytoene dehydrogenase-like protein